MNHKPIPKLTDSDIARFWDKVEIQGPNDCWEWIASTRNGYGRFSLNCIGYGAHRVSYAIANKDPKNLCVCHTCDNRICVNPSHLWLGTIQEDMDDKVKKGRQAKGEDHGQAHLTEKDVKEILDSDEIQSKLAKEYGVTMATISRLKRGISWRYIEDGQSVNHAHADSQTGRTNMNKVVYCKISSWVGRVFGAEHYYVDLQRGRYPDRVEEKVYHKLTQSEADRLNRRRIQDPEYPEPTWEAGEEVGYFFSKERAVRGAVAAYKAKFPGAVILVEGDIGTYEPQLILDGPSETMEAINKLVERAEAIDWWEDDEEAMQIINDEWKEIWISKYGEM